MTVGVISRCKLSRDQLIEGLASMRVVVSDLRHWKDSVIDEEVCWLRRTFLLEGEGMRSEEEVLAHSTRVVIFWDGKDAGTVRMMQRLRGSEKPWRLYKI